MFVPVWDSNSRVGIEIVPRSIAFGKIEDLERKGEKRFWHLEGNQISRLEHIIRFKTTISRRFLVKNVLPPQRTRVSSAAKKSQRNLAQNRISQQHLHHSPIPCNLPSNPLQTSKHIQLHQISFQTPGAPRFLFSSCLLLFFGLAPPKRG